MNERIKLPVNIRLDDLPEDLSQLLGTRNLPGELHPVTGAAAVEPFCYLRSVRDSERHNDRRLQRPKRGELAGRAAQPSWVTDRWQHLPPME
jgi:hypothetical protein